MEQRPSVVVLGGGTGTYNMLLALKTLPIDVTAILTMVDDGGSNRVLRDQFGLLPTSGICQCISALSDDESILRELFSYRFHQGEGLSGMRFGNLFLAAVTDIMGSQKMAIEETLKLLRVRGHVLPVSYDNVRLVAKYEDGSEVVGEHMIDEPQHDGKLHIVNLWTQPEATISPEAHDALQNADVIVVGPGDFYTNTVANFVIKGIPEALKNTQAKIVFVTNLMTKYGDTYNYTLKTYLDELDKYFSLEKIDTVLYNSNLDYPKAALKAYQRDNAIPVEDDIVGDEYKGTKIVREDLLSEQVFEKPAGDVLARSLLRHDPAKIASWFSHYLEQVRSR